MAARGSVVRSVVDSLCATLGPSLRSLVENFLADLNKAVGEAFCASSLDSQARADAAIDGITLCFTGGAASKNGGSSTKSWHVVDTPVDPEVIMLKVVPFL